MVEFVARRARRVEARQGLSLRPRSPSGLRRASSWPRSACCREAGAVGFTDGNRALATARVMRRALAYVRRARRPDRPAPRGAGAGRSGGGDERGRDRDPARAWPAIPRMAEVDHGRARPAPGRADRRALPRRPTSRPPAAIDAVRKAKARGLPVTCETAPHHLALNELEVEGYRTFAKVSPPLRAEDDRQAVVAGLARRHHRRDRERPLRRRTRTASGCRSPRPSSA